MRRMTNLLPPLRGLLPLAVLLLAWQILQGPSVDLPPPSAWWFAVLAVAGKGALWPALAATLWTYLAGLTLGCLLGFGLGILIGTNRPLREWLSMLLEFLRALPPPVIIPVAVLIGGYSPSMKVGVIAITASWPILLNTVTGAINVQGLLLEVARALRMSRIEMLWTIVIPATIPDFLIGMRIAMSVAIVTTLLVEMFTGLPGIGVLMMLAQRSYDSAQVFGLLAIVGILAFGLSLLFAIIESLILRRWPPRHGAAG